MFEYTNIHSGSMGAQQTTDLHRTSQKHIRYPCKFTLWIITLFDSYAILFYLYSHCAINVSDLLLHFFLSRFFPFFHNKCCLH